MLDRLVLLKSEGFPLLASLGFTVRASESNPNLTQGQHGGSYVVNVLLSMTRVSNVPAALTVPTMYSLRLTAADYLPRAPLNKLNLVLSESIRRGPPVVDLSVERLYELTTSSSIGSLQDLQCRRNVVAVRHVAFNLDFGIVCQQILYGAVVLA